MANEKTINARVQLKIDTEENWKKSVLNSANLEIGHPDGKKTSGTSFVPKKGEIIIYAKDSSYEAPRLKVGNGIDNILVLPFIDAGTVNGKQVEQNITLEAKLTDTALEKLTSKGDILYYNGTEIDCINIGLDNNFLTIENGLPVWTEISKENFDLENVLNETQVTLIDWDSKDNILFYKKGDSLENILKIVGENIDISTINDNNINKLTLGLPTASENQKGGIKVGSGLTMNEDVLNHSNSITPGTISGGSENNQLSFGDNFTIPKITYDSQGHITEVDITELTLPASSPTVEQKSTKSDKWRKLLLHNNEDSISDFETEDATDKVFHAKDISAQASSGTIRANRYRVANEVEIYYNSEDKSLDFIFFDEEEES